VAAVPPCLSCHGEEALASYPRLTHLPAFYIEAQLRLWRDSVRGEGGQDALMAPIAAALTDQQMRDVATFFAAGADG
jgi:cytochrome c553